MQAIQLKNMVSARTTRAALWACLILFALIIVKYGVLPSFNNTRGDFANYYTGSRLVKDGIPVERAYRDFSWFQKQMDRYGIQNQVGGFIPHPPPTTLVFLPLVFFDPTTAKNLWTLINIGLVFLNIFLLSRVAKQDWLITAVLFLGTGYGLLNNFFFGQLYLLVLASILLGLYLSAKRRFVLAGISLGSLVLVKYVGIVFLVYYAIKRKWRLVTSALITVLVVFAATAILANLESMVTFVMEVLPRHLCGEIQDPFSIYFQSWNSLFSRLFLFEETMNPDPPFPSTIIFLGLKHSVFWLLLGLTAYVLWNSRFQKKDHASLFQLGLLPCALLLVSPANTTYYFLLLTITAVFFTKILLDNKRFAAAAAIGALFVCINLPHFMKLRSLAQGWLTPLVYSRLWLLLIFFVLSLFLFRHSIRFVPKRGMLVLFITLLLISGSTVQGVVAFREETRDSAKWLKVQGPDFDRHLGVLLKSPDVGRREMVFSYCELMDEDYAIYGRDGNRWTLAMRQNFYDPDLATNDSSLLTVTVWNGRYEIWLSSAREELPVYLTTGESPSWHPNGRDFAFLRDGQICIGSTTEPHGRVIKGVENSYDLAFSPQGRFLVYCVEESDTFTLRVYELSSGRERVVLSSKGRIEAPCWSPREDKLVFSWSRNRNRDIWVIDLATRQSQRLTRHRATDTSPAWDKLNQRIVFASDRDRGLEFSTLYWISVPEELTER